MRLTLTAIMLFLFVIALSAQGPIVKFYLYQDCSPKEYKLSEIMNFEFIKSKLSKT
jgi:hypothetical protein